MSGELRYLARHSCHPRLARPDTNTKTKQLQNQKKYDDDHPNEDMPVGRTDKSHVDSTLKCTKKIFILGMHAPYLTSAWVSRFGFWAVRWLGFGLASSLNLFACCLRFHHPRDCYILSTLADGTASLAASVPTQRDVRFRL